MAFSISSSIALVPILSKVPGNKRFFMLCLTDFLAEGLKAWPSSHPLKYTPVWTSNWSYSKFSITSLLPVDNHRVLHKHKSDPFLPLFVISRTLRDLGYKLDAVWLKSVLFQNFSSLIFYTDLTRMTYTPNHCSYHFKIIFNIFLQLYLLRAHQDKMLSYSYMPVVNSLTSTKYLSYMLKCSHSNFYCKYICPWLFY